jgi:hypothetical protein
VRVELYDGQARLPTDEPYVSAESIGFDANAVSFWIRTTLNDYDIVVEEPGRWRFTCARVEGYVTPPPIELDISRVEKQRVVFNCNERCAESSRELRPFKRGNCSFRRGPRARHSTATPSSYSPPRLNVGRIAMTRPNAYGDSVRATFDS